MARKVYSFDPLDTDRKILANAKRNQREAVEVLKEIFGKSITSSEALSKPSLERIARLAQRLEKSVTDLERVTTIPKPKPRQPQFKPKGKGRGRTKGKAAGGKREG